MFYLSVTDFFTLFLKGDQQSRDSHAQGFAKMAPNGQKVTKLDIQGSFLCILRIPEFRHGQRSEAIEMEVDTWYQGYY